MSNVTELVFGQITHSPQNTILIELVEADETPAVVIVQLLVKPTVIHPHRFPTAADTAARTFAAAAARLAAIRRYRRL